MVNKIMNKSTTVPKSRKYNPLNVYLNEKVVMDHVLTSVTNLNVSYSTNRDYMIELFKKVVAQIDKMETKDKEAMATYFVKNINQEVNN